MTEKPATDWEAIEREYRAGQLSVSEIGRQHGVSHTAINKKAKRFGWTRDLTARIKAEVSARLVSDGVSADSLREQVDQSAARVVMVVREHRATLAENRSIVGELLAELRDTIRHIDEIEDAIEDETAGDRDGRRRSRMLAAVALPSRANVALTLANALRTLIVLERQAFSIGDGSPPGDEPATKDDLRAILESLNGGQRDQLRAIAGAVARGPDKDTPGA